MGLSTLKDIIIESINILSHKSIIRGQAKAFAMRNKLNKYNAAHSY